MSLPHPLDDPRFYEHLVLKRFLAWCIDLAVTLILVVVALAGTAFLGLFFLPVLWTAVAIAYRTVMLARYGATVGMMVVAITLRRLDGSRPDPLTCFWHAAIYAGSIVFFFVGQIVSIALMLLTPYKQGLNDLILGTTQVNRFIET